MPSKKDPVPIALWNPLWTVIWSFIFSPIFGTLLQRANWREMGEIDKAQISSKWLYASLIVVAALLFGEPFLPEEEALSNFWFIIIWTIWYLIWSFANGTDQIKEVNRRYGHNFHHKLWGRPLMIGACGLVLWMAISMTYVIGLILSGVIVITG